ncbi:hypothetical protein HX109_14145 [Galbibacter sp. BG1]|uniref:hypothetical protein n=1 Tax=Galbibacter sp. BG1 TaxID=1170699 RepID=UPI0015B80938|nr:hypothetical protein [Galbibacter sp. BG1]QLE02643.1 hypothetical protein HX109_14145 [Galbibacter sp. BG1]
MNRNYPIFSLLFIFVLISCSSSESMPEDLLEEINSENYFPLEISNNWNYSVDSSTPGKDSLWISSDTLVEGQLHYRIKGKDPKLGFLTNVLSNSLLHKTKNKIILNGEIADLFPGIKIPLEDLVLLDTQNPVGNDMYQSKGSSSYTIGDYNIEVNYDITSRTDNIFKDYTFFEEDYSNVIKTSIIVNAQGIVTTTINGFEVSVPILKPQDVIISTQYFAPGVGIINNETSIEYELSNLDQVDIPLDIPKNTSEVISQSITTFSLK